MYQCILLFFINIRILDTFQVHPNNQQTLCFHAAVGHPNYLFDHEALKHKHDIVIIIINSDLSLLLMTKMKRQVF